ncbi:carboxymuconolactone decarboxylase family protein [Castellaniella sp. GW247-6E4]|uniref:carboxymuconolactone decarboxylase family protein n=1 Tax=Castellaniella sp. GW247-6E4 TaxID=3140380 RepID=UPI003314B7A6
MQARMDYFKAAPELMEGMLHMEKTVKGAGLDPLLYELVKTRASQINGCAYCLHMHTTDARKMGETEMRLYLLNAWRESSLYTPAERAALAWTEALTLVAQTGAPDADYDGLREHFSDKQIVALTLLITTINAWNRLAIGFRSQHPKS